MNAATLDVHRAAGSLGAEIRGVDLARELPDTLIAAIRKAWLDHGVLFFRDQGHLTSAQYLAFAERFGQVIEYPLLKGLPEFPQITPVIKLEHERNNFGGIWHSDTTYLEAPPMASMLLAREIPPFGGDTIFANMYQAWDDLSEGMKRMLDGLYAVATSAKADVTKTREDLLKGKAREDARAVYEAEHPIARRHPETGRIALYVNFGHTLRIKGMTEEESAPILNTLFQHQTRPEYTCRFQWTIGAIAFWDNRCTQHNPVNDYHGYKRVMHRITLAGDRPK